MAKIVSEQSLKYTVLIVKNGEDINVTCEGEYQVSADGLSETRRKYIDLTAEIKTKLIDFGKSVVLKGIKAEESK